MTATTDNWRIDTDSDGIAWLTFDKAGASTNVLSGEVMRELGERIDDLEKQAPKAVVVCSAKATGFVAGADIKEFTGLKGPDDALRLIRGGQQVLERLERLSCPTIALINGFALGGGLELALACRYRIALDDPKTQLGLPQTRHPPGLRRDRPLDTAGRCHGGDGHDADRPRLACQAGASYRARRHDRAGTASRTRGAEDGAGPAAATTRTLVPADAVAAVRAQLARETAGETGRAKGPPRALPGALRDHRPVAPSLRRR